MAVSPFALVSLSEVKAFLGLTDDDTNRDTWLEGEINRLSERVERWCDRRIRARVYREEFDPHHVYQDYTIHLDRTPIIEVQSLHSDGKRVFDDDSLISPSHYNVYQNRVELAYPEYLFTSLYGSFGYDVDNFLRTVRIDYVAGWGTLDIPFDRQRIDLMEESNGDRLTFYLDAGTWTPTQIVAKLNAELNTDGDNEREISFDWRSRTFTITQEDGDLTLLPSVTGTFTESESALPLLGYTGSGHTSSPATGTAVTLNIPADLQGVIFDLLATRFDNQTYGEDQRRGIKSKGIGDFRVEYAGTSVTEATMEFPEPIMSVLTQYRRWTFIGNGQEVQLLS